MSTKRFCDGCGKEITESSRLPLVLVGPGCVVCEPGRDETDFCRYCLIDALVKLDDRPKLPSSIGVVEQLWSENKAFRVRNDAQAAYIKELTDRPACDHAELVRLVKALVAHYDAPGPGERSRYLQSLNALIAYARTLP